MSVVVDLIKDEPEDDEENLLVEVKTNEVECCCQEYKCELNIPQEDVAKFIADYQNSANKVKFYDKYAKKSSRNKCVSHHLLGRKKFYPVCRKFFEATLGKRPETVIETVAVQRFSRADRARIQLHIETFPLIAFDTSGKRFFRQRDLTLEKMFEKFVEVHSRNPPDIAAYRDVLEATNIGFLAGNVASSMANGEDSGTNQLSQEIREKIVKHIETFPRFILNASGKQAFSQIGLTSEKMYEKFLEIYPLDPPSMETYRQVLEATKIGFIAKIVTAPTVNQDSGMELTQEASEKIEKHIKSFPHFTCKTSGKEFFLPGPNVNLVEMWRNYLSKHPADLLSMQAYKDVLEATKIEFLVGWATVSMGNGRDFVKEELTAETREKIEKHIKSFSHLTCKTIVNQCFIPGTNLTLVTMWRNFLSKHPADLVSMQAYKDVLDALQMDNFEKRQQPKPLHFGRSTKETTQGMSSGRKRNSLELQGEVPKKLSKTAFSQTATLQTVVASSESVNPNLNEIELGKRLFEDKYEPEDTDKTEICCEDWKCEETLPQDDHKNFVEEYKQNEINEV